VVPVDLAAAVLFLVVRAVRVHQVKGLLAVQETILAVPLTVVVVAVEHHKLALLGQL
jgi:hypothetical protein